MNISFAVVSGEKKLSSFNILLNDRIVAVKYET